jgi:hypothetical protein
MGNNPINSIDPDGGTCYRAGKAVPCDSFSDKWIHGGENPIGGDLYDEGSLPGFSLTVQKSHGFVNHKNEQYGAMQNMQNGVRAAQSRAAGVIAEIGFEAAMLMAPELRLFRGSGLMSVGFQGTAFKSAGKGINKAIVIGEGMGAIKNAAKSLQAEGINAKWYQAWSKNFPKGRPMTASELETALVRNNRWIHAKVNQGYKVYDIGIDAIRPQRSVFYKLEKQVIKDLDYNVTRIPR